MKKIFITLIFVAAAFISQAQLFIGGSIGAKFNNGIVDYTVSAPGYEESGNQHLQHSSTIDIRPMIGYRISDNASLGLRIGYTNSTVKNCSDNFTDNYDIKNVTSHYGFAPFFRYNVLNFNKLKIFADAELPISFASEKDFYENENTTTEVESPKQFNVGLLVVPGLLYEITENLSFVSELGLLNFGFVHQRIKHSEEVAPETSLSYVQKNNQYGIGINNHVQATIGFIYTF